MKSCWIRALNPRGGSLGEQGHRHTHEDEGRGWRDTAKPKAHNTGAPGSPQGTGEGWERKEQTLPMP